MKSCISLGLALFIGVISSHAAPILRVEIIGTVTIEVAAAGGGTKKETSGLDNERLFTEFGLAKSDYVLVYNNAKLQFFPKNNAQLDPVTVFASPDGHQLTNTAQQSGRVMGPATSAQETGLFKEFAGTFFGKVTFGAAGESRSIDVVGVGTNPSPTTNSVGAHLRFKMVTRGQFIP